MFFNEKGDQLGQVAKANIVAIRIWVTIYSLTLYLESIQLCNSITLNNTIIDWKKM